MLLKNVLPVVVAGAAMLAIPLSGYADRHRDGTLKPAEAEGIGKQSIDPQTGLGLYSGTLRASDGDRSNLRHAWFAYEFVDSTSALGSISASGETCYLASFKLDIHRD